MKVSEYMATITAVTGLTGEITGQDMVLGLDCSDGSSSTTVEPKDYAYCGMHIEDVGAELDANTEDKSYVYEGDSTLKTSTQRTFSLSGQRYVGDDFQDFVCSFAVAFGKGSAVQRNYVYFNRHTKKGEKGTMTIIVNNDGNGAATSVADIDVELKSSGPVSEFTYSES